MAVNETSFVDGVKKEKVVFVDVTAFGKNAENLAKYIGKGDPLFLEGRLDFSQWENQAGEKRSKLSVICDRFQFIGGKKEKAEASADDKVDYTDIPF